MACTRAVAVLLGTLLALTQSQIVRAGVARADVASFGGSSHSSGAAESQITEADGSVSGECAYLDPQGNTIKIKYRQDPSGQVKAQSDPPIQNPANALATCRRAAEAASRVAQDSILKTQQELLRQQQELQEQLLQQSQVFQHAFGFPKFFGLHNQFQFPPFGQL